MRAIENADVLSGLNILGGDLSSLPIKVLDSKFESDKELEYLFNIEPNLAMTGKDLIYVTVVNAILTGNSYIEIERNESGHPVGLHYISNDRIVNIKKKSSKRYIQELIYEVRDFGDTSKTRDIKGSDVIHFKIISTDGLIGRSPLLSLKDTLEADAASKKFFSSYFKQGTSAGGIINVAGDLNSEDKQAVREAWEQANSGLSNSHRIVVLDEGTTYSPITVDNEVLKLINNSNHNSIMIAKVLGIPLHKFGIETHSISLEQAGNDYVINTLNHYIDALETEFNRKLFADKTMRQSYSIKFDTSVYKYADSKTKVENVKAQVELGLLSINEGREMMNLPPIENGDRYIQSLNFMDSELISEYQLKRVDGIQKNVVDENKVSEEPLEGGEE